MKFFILICITLVSMFQVGCIEREKNDAAAGDKPIKSVINDIGIAKIATPDGWSSFRSDGNTALIFTRTGASRQDPIELISIDIGTPVGADLKESAEGFADKFAGTTSALPFNIDGAPAYRISIPANYKKMVPRECIAVHHKGKVFFMIAGTKSKDDIWPTLSKIAQSWKWK